MTLQQARYFLAAAKCGSYSQAAEQLFVDPSSISKCISALEGEFGAKLFIRRGNALSLTEAGNTLHLMADKLLDQYAVLQDAMAPFSSKAVRVRIFGSTYCSYHLLPYCTDFSRTHPNINLEFPVVPNQAFFEPLEMVINGEADLGICFSVEGTSLPKEIASMQVGTDSLCLMVPPNHPLAERGVKKIHFQDLPDITILPTSSMLDSKSYEEGWQSIVAAISARLGRPLDMLALPKLPKPNAELFLQAKKYRCAFLCPKSMGHPSTDREFLLFEIEDMPLTFPVNLVWRRDRDNPALHLLLGYLHQHIPGNL